MSPPRSGWSRPGRPWGGRREALAGQQGMRPREKSRVEPGAGPARLGGRNENDQSGPLAAWPSAPVPVEIPGLLGNLGIAYGALGQYAKAIEHHTQALAIARETGDKRSEGITLGNLGSAYDALGQHAEAVEHHLVETAAAFGIVGLQLAGGAHTQFGPETG